MRDRDSFCKTTRIMKLRDLDETTYGVTIPKGDLRRDGLLDHTDDPTDDFHIVVRHVEPGKWELEAAGKSSD